MSTTRCSIKLPTYNCKVVFMITDRLNSQVNRIYRKHKIDIKYKDVVEGVSFTLDIDAYYLIINEKHLTHNTIAHEIFHTVMKITQDRGIKEEEARAWVAGHVSEGIYKFLDKKNLQVKHG